MNSGVEILLQRLKDNPEYFGVDPSMYGSNHQNKWSPFLSEVLNTEYFTDEEKQAVRTAFNDARRENFTERIMKALTGEDEVSEMGKPVRITSTNPYHSGSAPLTMTTMGGAGQSTVSFNNATSSITLGQTQLAEAQLKAMMDELKIRQQARKDREQEREKRSKTLYGKLHQYFSPI